ncbi:MAG: TonB-dependent receptor [Niabella sp.]|nr:TonB-dependent receptor [Niabella sp.]
MKPFNRLRKGCFLSRGRLFPALIVLLTIITTEAHTQEKKGFLVRGIVTNVNNEPLKQVVVYSKEVNKKTITDDEGKFLLEAIPKGTLVVAAEGYVTQSLPVNNTPSVSIKLAEQYAKSDNTEYVNILYGRQKKETVTAAVSQINGSVFENRAILNNTNKLTGLLPGLFVMQDNGEPGSESASLFVRGKRTMRSNSPVILVDGIERSMEMLDPSDIETVTVLKDAAATAQYGLRGGNGIVLVTTKRGREGKIKINFNARSGLKSPTTTPKFLDAYDYATLYNEAMHNDNPDQTPMYNPVDLAKFLQARNGGLTGLDAYLYPNVDWYNSFLKKQTTQQRYSLNIDGGNKYAKYFVSVGYTKNNGLYKTDPSVNSYNTNTTMGLFTLRSNLDVNVNKRLTLSLDLAAKQEERTYPGDRTDAALRLFRALYKTPPNAYPVLTPDGKIAGTKDYTSNPYGLLNYQGYSLYYTRNMFATLRMKHELDFITKGLSFVGSVSFDNYYEQTTLRNKTFKVYQISTVLNADGTRSPQYNSDSSLKYIETGSNTQMGKGGSYNDTRRLLNYEAALDFKRTFGNHSVTAYAGFVQREIGQENNTNVPRLYRGYNGRVSYSYLDKYLADFTIGYQASEQMPPWAKYNLFPAGSVGWIVSKERFLANNKFINFLKLRASHGRSGWDDIGGYFLWFQQYASSGGINLGNTAVSYTGWNESAFALNNVQPERAGKTNFGIDAQFLNNKLSITADYFVEKETRIMIQPELPYTMGIRFPDMPISAVRNKGYELSVGFSDHVGGFNYSITGIVTEAHNNVLAKGEAKKLFDYQMSTGRPLDAVFGLVAEGLFRNQNEIDNSPTQTFGVVKPGDIKYRDINKDGVIDDYDRVYLGTNADPTFQYGINLNLQYKGVDLNALLTGQGGGHIYPGGEAMYEFHDNGTVRQHHLGRFNPDDPDSWATATYPRLSLANKANNQRTSTYWQLNANLTRLKNIEIGYTFPSAIARKIKASNARLYINGYNLLTWQPTDIMDIEARSVHYVLYPIQKIYNMGLNITF